VRRQVQPICISCRDRPELLELTPHFQVADADRRLAKAKQDAEAYAKEAQASAIKKVDQFDRKVEEGASKAKSGISGWFGGSSK